MNNNEPLTGGHCKQTTQTFNNMTEEQLKQQFQQIEDNFNVAVISNSVDVIKKYITSDWVLVDSQVE